jgi:flagellar hook protein FlgE
MVRSLTSGVSGVQQFQGKLDVIGNNIANSNTYGFKTGRADFEDSFSQQMEASGGPAVVQVGSGVTTGSVRSMFETGLISKTGIASDMAINGDGFFQVKDPVSGDLFLTRAGDFIRNSEGYLVNSQGFRVQGYMDSSLTARGDIKIDDAGKPEAITTSMTDYKIEKDGKIKVVLGGNGNFIRGQVLLQRVQDPDALIKEGNSLFSGMEDAGALAQIEVPGTNGLGEILGGQIESSNVDLANEFASMITAQRGFQASARIITTTDEMLQEVVNLKR